MMFEAQKLTDRELAALERARQKAELIAWLRREAAARDGDMAWYVARTKMRADSVAEELIDAGIDAVCPLQRSWRRYPRSNRRYAVDNPLFGNYLFVRLLMAENAWVGLLTFDGISHLQGNGERPVPLRPSEMGKILDLLGVQPLQPAKEKCPLAVGDRVVHPIGTFAELHSTVMAIDPVKREALVQTMLFGREMQTRCAIDDIERLS